MERVLDSVERAAEIEELEEAMIAKSKVGEVAETQEEARARAKLKESLLAKSAHLSEKIEYMEREDMGRKDDKGFIPMGILCEYGRLLRESLDVAAKIEELEGKVAEAEEEEGLWEDEEELLRTQYEESLLEQWVKMVDNDAVEEVEEESLLEQWVKMVDNDAVEEV
ncbi:hypothetical protein OROMI_008914 [Orobanche minor]